MFPLLFSFFILGCIMLLLLLLGMFASNWASVDYPIHTHNAKQDKRTVNASQWRHKCNTFRLIRIFHADDFTVKCFSDWKEPEWTIIISGVDADSAALRGYIKGSRNGNHYHSVIVSLTRISSNCMQCLDEGLSGTRGWCDTPLPTGNRIINAKGKYDLEVEFRYRNGMK